MSHSFSGIVHFVSRRRERSGFAKRSHTGLAIACLALAAGSATAGDVKVQPAAGNGFVVTDNAGSTERLRVNEAGDVYMPGLATSSSTQNGLCQDAATGKLGTCPAAPIPAAACGSSQMASYNGSAWVCTNVQPMVTTTVTTTTVFTCGSAQCSLAAQAVATTCPNNWWAVRTWCSKPASAKVTVILSAAVAYPGSLDAYPGSETSLAHNYSACIYDGLYGPFSTETLSARTLCVNAPKY